MVYNDIFMIDPCLYLAEQQKEVSITECESIADGTIK